MTERTLQGWMRTGPPSRERSDGSNGLLGGSISYEMSGSTTQEPRQVLESTTNFSLTDTFNTIPVTFATSPVEPDGIGASASELELVPVKEKRSRKEKKKEGGGNEEDVGCRHTFHRMS